MNALSTTKRATGVALLLALASMSLTGCAVVGGIFKAGVGLGIIGVVLLLALVGGAIALIKR